MTNSVPQTSLSADVISYVRYQLRGRRGLIVAAAALGIPALWIGWPWLVVAGIAPILIALAPCAIMCALGYCAMKPGTKSNSSEADSNVSRSDMSCCAQSPASDEKVVTLSRKGLTKTPAEPVSIAAATQANLNAAEAETKPQAAQVELAGEMINEEKEKSQ